MKYSHTEIRLGTPRDFLLGITRTNSKTKDDYLFSEISFGMLFFSIAIMFKITE